MELNAKAIEAAQPGHVLNDTTIRGLHMRVSSVRKAYYLFYRTKARDARRPKLGAHPVLKLPEARENARKLLVAVAPSRGARPRARAQGRHRGSYGGAAVREVSRRGRPAEEVRQA